MARKQKTILRTPHAALIVWNYKNRLGSTAPDQSTETFINETEKRILSTVSLINLQTTKSKSNPVGQFTATLAPTKNWINTLTAGSWVAILMSNKLITKKDLNRASPEKVKMFGRIESVRVSVQVNPENGARQTLYRVTGSDWGSIFNNILYIDPVALEQGGVGTAGNLLFTQLAKDKDGKTRLATSRGMIEAMLKLWGAPLAKFDKFKDKTGLIVKPTANFTIPAAVAAYFKFFTDDESSGFATKGAKDLAELFDEQSGGKQPKSKKKVEKRNLSNMVDILNLYTGTLTGNPVSTGGGPPNPEYESVTDSGGYIQPGDIFGAHTIWQVIQNHANHTLNETYCDLRWEPDGRPSLALYNRIKPFFIKKKKKIVDTNAADGVNPADAEKFISRFTDIRKTKIPLEEVVGIEAGTNWRDKYNFVEIRSGVPDQTSASGASAEIKRKGQLSDESAFQREGFKPFIATTKQLPISEKSGKSSTYSQYDFEKMAAWKYLLREWYFDTHRLLNGTITIIGQNSYIAVGDNIMVPAEAFGPTDNMNYDHTRLKDKTYVLLHIENISHNFSVQPDGSRIYMTTINFVRGLIVNSAGEVRIKGITDDHAHSSAPKDDKNKENIFGSSDKMDPDPQKLKGS